MYIRFSNSTINSHQSRYRCSNCTINMFVSMLLLFNPTP